MRVRFLDLTAKDFVPVKIENNLDMAEEQGGRQARNKTYRPCLAAWLVAWDKYAIAADVLGQMSFLDSRAHRRNVTEVRQ